MAEKEKPRVDKDKVRSDRASRRRIKATRGPVTATDNGATRTATRGGTVPKTGVPQTRSSEQVAKVRGGLQGVKKYLKAVRSEFSKITWPTPQELRAATVVVIAILVVVTFYLFVVNGLINKVFERIAG